MLHHLSKSTFKTAQNRTDFYRLGMIEGATYDLVELPAGYADPSHFHKQAEGWILFVFGTGVMILGDERIEYTAGESIFIPT